MQTSKDTSKSIERLRNREDLQTQMRWIERAQDAIACMPEIAGAVILGSIAKDCADYLSDVDLVLFTERKYLSKTLEILSKDPPYEIVHEWRENFSENHVFGKWIYRNFFSVEIHVLSLENDFKIHHPMIILKDSEAQISGRIVPGLPPSHQEYQALAGGAEGLGWELFDMFKWWQRGQKELARTHLLKIAHKLSETSEAT